MASALTRLPKDLFVQVIQKWLSKTELLILSLLDQACCGNPDLRRILDGYVTVSSLPTSLEGSKLSSFLHWVVSKGITLSDLLITRSNLLLDGLRIAGLKIHRVRFEEAFLGGPISPTSSTISIGVTSQIIDFMLQQISKKSLRSIHAFISGFGKDEVLSTIAMHAEELELEELIIRTESNKASSLLPSTSMITKILEGTGCYLKTLRFINIRLGELAVMAIARYCHLLEQLEFLPHMLTTPRPLLDAVRMNSLLIFLKLSMEVDMGCSDYLPCARVNNDLIIKVVKLLPALQVLHVEQTAVNRRALPQIMKYRPQLRAIYTDDLAVCKISSPPAVSEAEMVDDYEVNFKGEYRDMEYLLKAFGGFDRIDFQMLEAQRAVLTPIFQKIKPQKVTVLSLQWTAHSSMVDVLPFFQRFHYVHTLTFTGCAIDQILSTKDFIACFQVLPDLHTFRLCQAPSLATNAFLGEVLPYCPALTSLELFDAPLVTDDAWLILANCCPRLRHFGGMGCSFTIEGVKAMLTLPQCRAWGIEQIDLKYRLQWDVEFSFKYDNDLKMKLGSSLRRWQRAFRVNTSGWF